MIQISKNKNTIFLLLNNLVNEVLRPVVCLHVYTYATRSMAQLSLLEYFKQKKLLDHDGPLSWVSGVTHNNMTRYFISCS